MFLWSFNLGKINCIPFTVCVLEIEIQVALVRFGNVSKLKNGID